MIEIPRPGVTYPVQISVINFPLQLEARPFGVSTVWKPSIYLDDPVTPKPFFNVTTEVNQLYTIDIRTAAGCLTTDTQLVKSVKEVKIYVPNAFTPNNNGLNDLLRPLLLGVKEIKYFRIYNRWGQLVYDMKTADRGWNGAFKGIHQPTGTFVWIVQGLGLDNKIYTQKGTTTLIR
jgi:gliding motility-associated-like protein